MVLYLLSEFIYQFIFVWFFSWCLFSESLQFCLSIFISKIKLFNLLSQLGNNRLLFSNSSLKQEDFFLIFVLSILFLCQQLRNLLLKLINILVELEFIGICFVNSCWILGIQRLSLSLAAFEGLHNFVDVAAGLLAEIRKKVKNLRVFWNSCSIPCDHFGSSAGRLKGSVRNRVKSSVKILDERLFELLVLFL